mmetsp:Transcript_16538/g.42198  ORF Transcript_16538/g.42198 Transcript_16538/m.42198 type:complete len:84 (-) Transcript_16538:92-343(-)
MCCRSLPDQLTVGLDVKLLAKDANGHAKGEQHAREECAWAQGTGALRRAAATRTHGSDDERSPRNPAAEAQLQADTASEWSCL